MNTKTVLFINVLAAARAHYSAHTNSSVHPVNHKLSLVHITNRFKGKQVPGSEQRVHIHAGFTNPLLKVTKVISFHIKCVCRRNATAAMTEHCSNTTTTAVMALPEDTQRNNGWSLTCSDSPTDPEPEPEPEPSRKYQTHIVPRRTGPQRGSSSLDLPRKAFSVCPCVCARDSPESLWWRRRRRRRTCWSRAAERRRHGRGGPLQAGQTHIQTSNIYSIILTFLFKKTLLWALKEILERFTLYIRCFHY